MRTSSRASNNPFAAMAQISDEQANEYILPSSSITMPEPTHYPPPITMPEPIHFSPSDVMSVPAPAFPVPMIDIPPPSSSAVPISPASPLSPLPPAATTSPPPASMSPDNMLRLYAERQAARLSPNKPIQHTSKGETALAVAAHQTTCFARTLCARVRFSSGIPAVENWRNGLPSLEARVRL